MSEIQIRQQLIKLASNHPELRQHLIPLLKKEAALTVDTIPQPRPWTIPVPWDTAKAAIFDNLQAFINAGSLLRKIRPVADPYVLLVYRSFPFTLQVTRRLATNIGNLWTESSDVQIVTARMPQLLAKVKQALAGRQSGFTLETILAMVKPITRTRWDRLLAAGVVASMLEHQGIVIGGDFPVELEDEPLI